MRVTYCHFIILQVIICDADVHNRACNFHGVMNFIEVFLRLHEVIQTGLFIVGVLVNDPHIIIKVGKELFQLMFFAQPDAFQVIIYGFRGVPLHIENISYEEIHLGVLVNFIGMAEKL